MTWLSVPGYEGVYAVSSEGEVMSMNYRASGLPGLLALSTHRGYKKAILCRRGYEKNCTVHSLVAAAFIGPRPAGAQINHKNGDKADNRVANLEYCTPSENKFHAFATGLQSNKGEKHSRARLTDAAVIDIRSRIGCGESNKAIAESWGVDPSHVSHIKSGRLWSHLSRKAG